MFTFTPNNIFLYRGQRLYGKVGRLFVDIDSRGDWFVRQSIPGREEEGKNIINYLSCIEVCRWLNDREYRPLGH